MSDDSDNVPTVGRRAWMTIEARDGRDGRVAITPLFGLGAWFQPQIGRR